MKETTTTGLCGGVQQLPGNGVLARYGDLTLLCDPAPGQQERVDTLLAALEDEAATRACGRRLSRRLAGLVGTTGLERDFPALCAFGPAGDGLAVFVHGDAAATLTINGKRLRLSGQDAVTGIDRVITAPVESVVAVIGDRDVEAGADRWSRLDAGVVRADAVVYEPDADASQPTRDTTAPADATEPVDPSDSTDPSDSSEKKDSADSATGDKPAEAEETESATPGVLGLFCKNAHFNDPSVMYCTVCGSAMTQTVRTPEWSVRPQLGVLVLDDGTTFPLVRDHVIGRSPEIDDAVATGDANGVALADPLISRLHARVELRDWQVTVVDAGSTNGTYVLPSTQSSWIRMAPGEEAALTPGSVVAFGQRQVRYYSHRNR